MNDAAWLNGELGLVIGSESHCHMNVRCFLDLQVSPEKMLAKRAGPIIQVIAVIIKGLRESQAQILRFIRQLHRKYPIF
jgi:hypothetical protein